MGYTRRGRRILAVALGVAVVVGTATAAAPSAQAAPAYHVQSSVIVGDLTADGIPDHITVGYFKRGNGIACAYELRAGLGNGKYGTPRTGNLPLSNAAPDYDQSCPDMGVVLRGPTPAQNQLAVSWFAFFPVDGGPMIRTVNGFARNAVRSTGAVDGMYQPSIIGARDFDGDGWDDIWENTDQGSGFQAFVGRSATGWHTLFATPYPAYADAQFFDLNHAGGTDLLVTWQADGDPGTSGVAAVDGRTGAVQILDSVSTNAFDSSYDIAVVDLNHDAFPDLLVTVHPDSGGPSVQRFLNESQGGRWLFEAL